MKKIKWYQRFLVIVLTFALALSINPPELYAAKAKFNIVEAVRETYPENIFTIAVKNDPGNLKWSSSNPNVATVENGRVFTLYPGTATITAENKKQKDTIKIIVNKDGRETSLGLNANKITLAVGESFQLGCGGAAKINWKSSGNAVEVSKTGLVTAKQAGQAKVTASSGKTKVSCEVRVVENSDAYLKNLYKKDYTVSDKAQMKEYDRFILVTDAGVCVPKDTPERIDLLMKTIEQVTGFEYYPKKPAVITDSDKVYIFIQNNGTMSGYSATDYVVLCQEDLLEESMYVMTHELTHIIQQRNSISIGHALSEGYAESYLDDVSQALGLPTGYNAYNMWMCMYPFEELTEKNMEKNLLDPPDVHPLSYFFVNYIRQKYGDKKIRTIIKEITKTATKKSGGKCWGSGLVLTEQEILKVIKKETSKNIIKDFAKWFQKLEKINDLVYDYRGTQYVHVDWANISNEYLSEFPFILDGEVIIDYAKVIAIAQNTAGKKYKGLSLNIWDSENNYSLVFLDANGKELRTVSNEESGYGHTIFVEKATAVKIVGQSERMNVHMDISSSFE